MNSAKAASQEIDQLVSELIDIGRAVRNRKDSSSGYLYLDLHRNTQKDTRAVGIGKQLNDLGRIDLMREAHQKIRVQLGAISGRELEVWRERQ